MQRLVRHTVWSPPSPCPLSFHMVAETLEWTIVWMLIMCVSRHSAGELPDKCCEEPLSVKWWLSFQTGMGRITWIFHSTEVDFILFKVAFSTTSGQGLVINPVTSGMISFCWAMYMSHSPTKTCYLSFNSDLLISHECLKSVDIKWSVNQSR